MSNVVYYFNLAKGFLAEKWTREAQPVSEKEEQTLPTYDDLSTRMTLLTVKDTLNEEWGKYKQPLKVNNDDLEAGIALFTKIAMNAMQQVQPFKKPKATYEVKSTHEVKFSSDAEPVESVEKIKTFVRENAYVFRNICNTGFPFSLLESSSSEIALLRALNHSDIIFAFMTASSDWITEEELNRRFAIPFQQLEINAIVEACSALNLAYQKGENKAGYYLIWLIKNTAGCSFEIPTKASFKSATAAKVLTKFIEENGSVTHVENFIEILHFRSSRFDKLIYENVLDHNACNIFLNYVIAQLQCIPFDNWPNKGFILTVLLETVSSQSKLIIAQELAASSDAKTAEVGRNIAAALTARGFNEAIAPLNALSELLPHFNKYHAQYIFDRPFVGFFEDFATQNAPGFVKRLSFNHGKVFVYDSIMIGVYADKENPPYLLAFDMYTKKMAWGMPLVASLLEDPSLNPSLNSRETGLSFAALPDYRLEQVGENLFLRFHEEKKVRFIDAKTGQCTSLFELPEVPVDPELLHISPEGFVYLVARKDQTYSLLGGKLIHGQWNLSFEVNYPGHDFLSLSTHCGAFSDKNQLILFGPTGAQVTIENCLAAEARENKIYLIEKDPKRKDKCIVTVRSLLAGPNVVSRVEKMISLDVERASFGDFCKNGQWVLFQGVIRKSLIFVDMQSEEVAYCYQPPIDSQQFINVETGEVWSWDQWSKEIRKISSTNITLEGTMGGSSRTSILWVDKGNQVYCRS